VRHRPRDGYGNIAKESQYRTRLYDYVDLNVSRPAEYRRVAILDTTEALEAAHLLKRGYSADRIWVANNAVTPRRAAAFKAVFTKSLRRHGFDNRCHVHPGADLLEVVREGANGYGFDVINYDSCGPIGGGRWLRHLIDLKESLLPGGVFCITIQAGRESRTIQQSMMRLLEQYVGYSDSVVRAGERLHEARRAIITLAMNEGWSHISRIDSPMWVQYVGSRVPMLAGFFRIAKGEGTNTTWDYWNRLSHAMKAFDASRDPIELLDNAA